MQWPQGCLKKGSLKSFVVFFASVKLVSYGNKLLLMDFLFNVPSLDWSIDPWRHDCQYWGEVCGHVNEVQDPETHQNHERECLESCPVPRETCHMETIKFFLLVEMVPSVFGWGSASLREEDAEAVLSFCSCGWTFMAWLENVAHLDCWARFLGRTWKEHWVSW